MSDDDKKQWINRRGAQPVSDLVSKLLDPVIERRAGMTMDLIGSWREIVGDNHAAKSQPEKLHWPRQISDDDPFEPATLIVACEGGHALYLQHDSEAVLAAVNDYFGYSAVARLKLVQKPVTVRMHRDRNRKRQLDKQDANHLLHLIDEVRDPQLKRALEKLGRGIFSKGSDT